MTMMALSPLHQQLSIPRTPEVGNIQQAAMQRPMQEQTLLELQAAKLAEAQRSQSASIDQVEKGIIRDQEKNNQQEKDKRKKESSEKTLDVVKDEDSIHPYKGHKLDIKL